MEKERKHPICEKHPVLGIILVSLAAFLIVQIPGLITTFVKVGDTIDYTLTVLFALISLIVLRLWFSPQFKGFSKPEIPLKQVFILCIPAIVISILSNVTLPFTDGYFYFNPTLNAVMMGLTAGVSEETLFRAAPAFTGMRYLKSENRSFNLALTVSIIFGLTHITNLAGGSGFNMTILQTLSAVGSGLMFIALYLRTGSIIPSMVIHGVYDWMCFVTDPSLTSDGLVTDSVDIIKVMPQLVLALIEGAIAIYMLRKSKRAEINEIWDRKWSNTSESRQDG